MAGTYIPTIGLEIHAELKTSSKMFCDCKNDPFEKTPNINVCPICMGHPGSLPTANKLAIEQVMRVGFALHGEVAVDTKFDRKNYFYPDLPKGYQISQYDKPIVSGGYLCVSIGEGEETIDLERVHLEEDTARMQHTQDGQHSLVDFNRSSIPLMELVTKPVIKSAKVARGFAEELQLILRYLDISDAQLENGLMRVELNISLAPEGSNQLGTKVEVKNLNSLSALESAARFEIERQKKLLDNNENVVQETRGWNPDNNETFSQRVKEEANDYRYFPEPDIPGLRLIIDEGFDRDNLQNSIPELPQEKKIRFAREYYCDEQALQLFISNEELAHYYEHLISELLEWENNEDVDKKDLIKKATNYFVKDIRTLISEQGIKIDDLNITPENFAEFIHLVRRGDITSASARTVLLEMSKTGGDPSVIVEEKGLRQQHDEGLIEQVANEVIRENPNAVEDYRKGKETVIKFLVGSIMAKTKGSTNPQKAEEVLKKELG